MGHCRGCVGPYRGGTGEAVVNDCPGCGHEAALEAYEREVGFIRLAYDQLQARMAREIARAKVPLAHTLEAKDTELDSLRRERTLLLGLMASGGEPAETLLLAWDGWSTCWKAEIARLREQLAEAHSAGQRIMDAERVEQSRLIIERDALREQVRRLRRGLLLVGFIKDGIYIVRGNPLIHQHHMEEIAEALAVTEPTT